MKYEADGGPGTQMAASRRRGRKIGHTFSQPDLIIAATAQQHGLTIVSRDTSDYEKARTAIFNPWVEPVPQMLP